MKVEVGKVYRHFKGNYYIVKEIGFDSETQEKVVIYSALYGEYITWVRPLVMFEEEIDINRADNVTKQKNRFEKVNLEKEMV